MKDIIKEEILFWKHIVVKGFVTAGITFFAVCASIGINEAIAPSLIAAGSYIFIEAGKYYGLQPNKKILNKTYSFFL